MTTYEVQVEMQRGAVRDWSTRVVYEIREHAIAKAEAMRDSIVQFTRGTGRFRVVAGAETIYTTETAMAQARARSAAKRKSVKIRDSQRQKLYNAEAVLRRYAKELPTVADMEKYVAKVLKRAPIVARYPDAVQPIAVCPGKWGQRRALAHGTSKISMPKWSRTDHIVLHEVAHIIAARVHGRTNIAGHGWQYAKVYIDLVHFMMGSEAADALKASFAKHGVKYKAPRAKVEMSPAAKAALVARLNAGKERKLAIAA